MQSIKKWRKCTHFIFLLVNLTEQNSFFFFFEEKNVQSYSIIRTQNWYKQDPRT